MNLNFHHHPNLRPLAVTLAALLGLAAATSAAAAGTETAEAEILAMDKNGDGTLTAAEHAVGARAMFTAMDGDQDGRVTGAEMDAYAKHRSVREDRAVPAADKIRKVDGNGDGVLTEDEHQAASLKMFQEMDTDHSGTLDKAELAVGHAKHLVKKPQ